MEPCPPQSEAVMPVGGGLAQRPDPPRPGGLRRGPAAGGATPIVLPPGGGGGLPRPGAQAPQRRRAAPGQARGRTRRGAVRDRVSRSRKRPLPDPQARGVARSSRAWRNALGRAQGRGVSALPLHVRRCSRRPSSTRLPTRSQPASRLAQRDQSRIAGLPPTQSQRPRACAHPPVA